MLLTGIKETDEDILEIARETVFNIRTAKEFFLITGDKEYCKELSFLFGKGYLFEHLEFLARQFALAKADKNSNEIGLS
ncbi:hypothetical protein F4V43_01985 [Paenibacillus spiritus]|uniref:Uncharacterized protein n=1 Tax=Paenibacillus spiritus TaxID=2496557 RepID=A0A5J5GGD1_9BACL|nr:hypothetical protein [Paenibacillus spiritus]KAA9007279.1 hypothetical protein F4V43_01985 [Paenibacillus spiritus]